MSRVWKNFHRAGVRGFSGARRVLVVLFVCAFVLSPARARDSFQFQEGDIVFQVTNSSQGRAVQLATKSRYTHVGMVVRHQGKLVMLEAVEPVRLTNIPEFLRRGVRGHYVVKRLKTADQDLKPEALARMRTVGLAMLGKNYDLYFQWSDSRIYCSELVWKVYHQGAGIELSPKRKIKEFDLSHPAVKRKIRERFPRGIDLEEPVVAPSDLFDSDRLVTVKQFR